MHQHKPLIRLMAAAAMLAALLCPVAAQVQKNTKPAQRVEVYVGVADNHMDQINHPDQWTYVRQNADGFYINFIELDSMYSQSTLDAYGKLFTNKNAFIESDMNSSTEKEHGYVDRLHKAGFTIPYTSLNYGWSKERQDGLKTYALKPGQKPRLCFVQDGPWNIGGTIFQNKAYNGVFSNSDYRSWVRQADGTSTDGPLGFWVVDQGSMKSASYSMVKFAHSLGKKSVLMLCPYGAGVASYTPAMYLNVGINCVREHEDNDADPDIWDVFEYATSIDAVPEQKEGAPHNSTTGMAYYLIKHIKGDPNTLDLYAMADSGKTTGKGFFGSSTLTQGVAASKTVHYTISAANLSSWCDYAGVLKTRAAALPKDWTIKFKLAGTDITRDVLNGGYKFYKTHRLNPQTTQQVELYITRPAKKSQAMLELLLELSPHHGSDTVDSLRIVAR
ncbi:MAG: hypothetical protein ACYC1M_10620 [Armatimonadota bacterium]